MKGAKGVMNPGPWWKHTADETAPLVSDMAPYISEKAGAGEVATQPAATEGAAATRTAGLVVGGEQFRAALASNSPNHLQEGQNVGFGDGHAEFVRGPNAGQRGDNVWTVTVEGSEKAVDAGMLPAAIGTDKAPFDTVMVPTRSAKGELR